MNRFIFNSSGEYVAFVNNNNLFKPDCEWIGFIVNGNEVYNTSGLYVGYVLDDDRIVRNTTQPARSRVPRPSRPLRPLRPLSPLKRLRMPRLPAPFVDVFEDSRLYGQLFLGVDLAAKYNHLVGASIIAQDGTFLGNITQNRFDQNSILNKFGPHGSQYQATSIFNKFGNYGSKFSNYSPFNKFSNTPPKIVKNNKLLGYLTVNTFTNNQIDTEEFMRWLETL